MNIQFISLKIYWEKERLKLEQDIHNCWIDQIVLPESGLYARASDGSIHPDDCRRAIEFGEYLFVSVNNKTNNVNAFAICVDHATINYNIWQNDKFSAVGGSFEISLICSKIRGQGAILINAIKNFSKFTLFRTHIQLIVNKKNKKLIEYYKSHGFESKSSTTIHLKMLHKLL